jgi:glycosyltransferase involved in cell wall biosynthesis
MASGCAVMLSEKVGGAVDLVQHGKNGIIFKIADLEKCSELIERLLVNKEELAAMKKASRELIRSFSFEQIVEAIESIMAKTSNHGGL